MKEWTRVRKLWLLKDSFERLDPQWFPYDFRGEEIMTLVKQIVARCESNSQLGDGMSDILSALLVKLTGLSQHEEEMKSFKKPLDEVIWR